MHFLAVMFIAFCFSPPAFAQMEGSYTHEHDRVSTPWYITNTQASKTADLAFIKHMRPHHAGALSMSKEYLADPASRNARLQQLARGIMHNQTFEIAVMNMIENHQSTAHADGRIEQVAEKDMAQKLVFWRAPMPGPLDRLYGDQNVSARDVQFAKAMIIHHEGALVMAQNYLDGQSRNGYLRRLCLDILRDQAQEIAYMHSIIDLYPEDANAIKISADMIHGMEGMEHMLPGYQGDEHMHHHMH